MSSKQVAKKNQGHVKLNILDTKVKVLAQIFFYTVIVPVILYSLFFLFLRYQHHLVKIEIKEVLVKEKKPIYWIYANEDKPWYLEHVFDVLNRYGFEQGTNKSDWDLLWAHRYPFFTLPYLKKLLPHQKVNHFPGCGYLTNKVELSTSESRFLPAAFKIPEQGNEFLKYAKEHPKMVFVEKSNGHRGIKIRKVQDINITAEGSFVQEFVQRPYLVDGYKFDMGIYTVITSINPLRIYTFKNDVLFRFCPVKYHPFDPEVIDKYVVGDDYLPIWKVPSLKDYYTKLGFSMKDSFSAHVKSQGKDPHKMWDNINEAIRETILSKEALIYSSVKRYKNYRNFFELVRFDCIIDEDLNVYVMEINMSPNLSSAHFAANRLLYEQVLYNLFALVGIGNRIHKDSLEKRNPEEEEMIVADKNLVVLPELCKACDDCFRVECQLCLPCFTEDTKLILEQTYLEHNNKMDFQRIFPPLITENLVLKDYSLRNQLMIRWYQGKCELDPTWCN